MYRKQKNPSSTNNTEFFISNDIHPNTLSSRIILNRTSPRVASVTFFKWLEKRMKILLIELLFCANISSSKKNFHFLFFSFFSQFLFIFHFINFYPYCLSYNSLEIKSFLYDCVHILFLYISSYFPKLLLLPLLLFFEE